MSVSSEGAGVAPAQAAAHAAIASQPRVLQRMLALEDFEEAARRYLPRPIFGYINGGAETNAALRGNREVWDEIAFVPKTPAWERSALLPMPPRPALATRTSSLQGTFSARPSGEWTLSRPRIRSAFTRPRNLPAFSARRLTWGGRPSWRR